MLLSLPTEKVVTLDRPSKSANPKRMGSWRRAELETDITTSYPSKVFLYSFPQVLWEYCHPMIDWATIHIIRMYADAFIVMQLWTRCSSIFTNVPGPGCCISYQTDPSSIWPSREFHDLAHTPPTRKINKFVRFVISVIVRWSPQCKEGVDGWRLRCWSPRKFSLDVALLQQCFKDCFPPVHRFTRIVFYYYSTCWLLIAQSERFSLLFGHKKSSICLFNRICQIPSESCWSREPAINRIQVRK